MKSYKIRINHARAYINRSRCIARRIVNPTISILLRYYLNANIGPILFYDAQKTESEFNFYCFSKLSRHPLIFLCGFCEASESVLGEIRIISWEHSLNRENWLITK